jgi:hypothetical protein
MTAGTNFAACRAATATFVAAALQATATLLRMK